ncbi:type-2 ice-structuring protein-like [Anneissia japonica]|uniref:type-2 ice-structuring protein-like n=1 Tax=Anneissia japonica TaxID=1529436 RepID=UPI0014255419|nr:type-2 ice-structuring protein-like [Anneissia japonica]
MDIIFKVLFLYHLCQFCNANCNGEFQGQCYTFECGNSDIDDAVDSCNSVGATLVSIHSMEEEEFVRELVRDSIHFRVFIGLILEYSTREYYWTDGSDVDYMTDAQDFEEIWWELCTALDGGRNYDWEDVGCSENHCGICKQVLDEEAPVITCPDAISDVADPNQSYAAMTLDNAEATDNIGVTHLYCSRIGSSQLNIGLTTITCTATDAANNQAQCTYDVTVTGTQELIMRNN